MHAFRKCKENVNLVNFYVLPLAPKYENQFKKKNTNPKQHQKMQPPSMSIKELGELAKI